MALEIEVRCARRRGVEAILSAKAIRLSGLSRIVQGTITFWSGGARPFHVGHGDLAQHPAADGVVDERRAEGLGEALPLQGLLVRVHGEGDVDGDDEGEVDLRLGRAWAGPGASSAHRQSQPCGKTGEAGTNHRSLLVGSRIGPGSVPASETKARSHPD